MNYEQTHWHLLEVVKGDRRPVSDEFADPAKANADERANIVRELRLVRLTGIPPDRERGNPDLQRCFKWSSPSGEKCLVYVLKAKPSHWRLYCYVLSRHDHLIEFIYAVKKKEQRRDPADQKACERILAGRHSGGYRSAPLTIPGVGERP